MEEAGEQRYWQKRSARPLCPQCRVPPRPAPSKALGQKEKRKALAEGSKTPVTSIAEKERERERLRERIEIRKDKIKCLEFLHSLPSDELWALQPISLTAYL
jgi:hypothetical protein